MTAMMGWRVLAVVAAVLAAAVTMMSPSWVTTAKTGDESGELRVTADPNPLHHLDLSPGDEVHWTQRVSLTGATSGRFSLRMTGSGELIDHPGGLAVAVRACTGDYRRAGEERPECSDVESRVLGTTALRQISSHPAQERTSRVWHLNDLRAEAPRSFAVTLSIPPSGADDASLMGLTGSVGIGFYASGDGARPGDSPVPGGPDAPDETLTETGGPAGFWWLAGAALVGAGLIFVAVSRRRRSES